MHIPLQHLLQLEQRILLQLCHLLLAQECRLWNLHPSPQLILQSIYLLNLSLKLKTSFKAIRKLYSKFRLIEF
jgi:hypothetical protein